MTTTTTSEPLSRGLMQACGDTNEQGQLFQCDLIGDIQCPFKTLNRSCCVGQVIGRMLM